ncbi:hypothetical protein FMEAI12_2720024 [Parafrankia sp. Ea1.12]|nr:hypothetical protein FMEAI12_2720024 [Parafrankia sp. Ea1.12]
MSAWAGRGVWSSIGWPWPEAGPGTGVRFRRSVAVEPARECRPAEWLPTVAANALRNLVPGAARPRRRAPVTDSVTSRCVTPHCASACFGVVSPPGPHGTPTGAHDTAC